MRSLALPGATCVDQHNYYFCRCRGGFYGARCQFDVDECASKPCLTQCETRPLFSPAFASSLPSNSEQAALKLP